MKIALIPAYNEEKNIREVLRRLRRIGIKAIVVDDGSRDRTYEIAKKGKAIVLRHPKNRGKGEAIRTGLNFILKTMPGVDEIVLIDADMQYFPEECMKFFEMLKKADYVMGARRPKDIPFLNRLGNFLWRKIFNILFGTNFLDTNCGYIGMNKKAMKEMSKVVYGGYILENAMLIQAIKKKLKIAHVPVKVVYKGKRDFGKFARMFFGILIFILFQGFKYRLSKL